MTFPEAIVHGGCLFQHLVKLDDSSPCITITITICITITINHP
jgi:hypothetical protein